MLTAINAQLGIVYIAALVGFGLTIGKHTALELGRIFNRIF